MITRLSSMSLLFFSFFALISPAFTMAEETPNKITSFYNPLDPLDYSRLESTIQKLQLDSVDKTLEVLKQRYPQSFEKYVLMYKSRSLQDASPLSPRALVIAGSKRMVFSFNGDPKQAGYNKLEIVNFIPETSRFEFREIHFRPGRRARFSEANPKKCMNCHQSSWRTQSGKNDPRPNWEPYNVWPGTYASLDVNTRLSEKRYSRPSLENAMGDQLFADHYKEAQWMADFESQVKPQHPRYKHLGKFGLRHPLEFTKVLARQNSFRIARLMTEDKKLYSLLRPTLARVINSQCKYSVLPQAPKEPGVATYAFKKTPLSQEMDAIFKPLGFDISDWSMDFQTEGQFAATGDRFQNPHDSRTFLGLGMALYDPEVYIPINEKFFGNGGSRGLMLARQTCKDMEALSNQTPSLHEISQIVKEAQDREFKKRASTQFPLIDRCISCHSDAADNDAPWIAFDDFSTLSRQLQGSYYPRGTLLDEIRYRLDVFTPSHDRMPKGSVPKRSDVETLLRQLETIGQASSR